jgi:hypothetical protein
MGIAAVPTLSLDRGVTHYLTEIRKFPMLRPDQEAAYAMRPITSSPAICGSLPRSP